MSNLRAVRDEDVHDAEILDADDEVYDHEREGDFGNPHIPSFEGQPVDGTKIRLTGVAGLEVDEVLKMDQVVRIVVEGRVTGIGHAVEEKTGRLFRVHAVKIAEAHQVPYDYDAEIDRA